MKRGVVALSFCLLALAGGSLAQAGDGFAQVYVVHGIPGDDMGRPSPMPVDVLVNDEACVLEGFTFGRIAGPLPLAAGEYDIKISPANPATPCGNDAAVQARVSFASGEHASVVAHLTADGDLTASKFVNDVGPAAQSRARTILHHAAAAPPVDLSLRRRSFPSGSVTVRDFANGDQVIEEVRSGRWYVNIAPVGEFAPVFGPLPVKLRPFRALLVYAVGSLDDDTFTLLSHEVLLSLPRSGASASHVIPWAGNERGRPRTR